MSPGGAGPGGARPGGAGPGPGGIVEAKGFSCGLTCGETWTRDDPPERGTTTTAFEAP